MQPSSRALRHLALLLLTGLPLGLAGCDRSRASETDELSGVGVRQREIPRVRVAAVTKGEMVQRLETTSVLESEREINVFPRLAGVSVEVLAEEGDAVRRGDVLARLDDQDQQLAVRDAEVALDEAKNSALVSKLAIEEAAAMSASSVRQAEQAERDFARNLKLRDQSETNVLSEQAVEASRLERDNAAAAAKQAEIAHRRTLLEEQAANTAVSRAMVALERARVAMQHMRIVAPFDGVVAERQLRIGDMVGSAEPAFILSDTSELRAVFYRPQEELELFSQVRRADGMARLSFNATAEAYPGRIFEGEVERISPTIDRSSGQFRVTARIRSSPDGRAPLLPGMLVRMSIITDRHNDALILPKRAIQREGERLFVLVVERTDRAVGDEAGAGEYTVRRVDVAEGFSDDDRVEILALEDGGISVGTLVVVVGSRDLTDGDPVAIELVGADADEDDEDDAQADVLPVAEDTQNDGQ